MKNFVYLLPLFVLAGCTAPETASTEKPLPAEAQNQAQPVAFKKDGKLWCPVMNHAIESEKDASSYQDVDGVRYYFCCDGCAKPFKADPQKYISAMKNGTAIQ